MSIAAGALVLAFLGIFLAFMANMRLDDVEEELKSKKETKRDE